MAEKQTNKERLKDITDMLRLRKSVERSWLPHLMRQR